MSIFKVRQGGTGVATLTGLVKANGTAAFSAATSADITSIPITGYVSGAGTITAADTILTAINKLNGNIAAGSGVTSFNTRTGAVTLTSGDVTTALTFTPYNSSNPSGYITSAGAPVQSVTATDTTLNISPTSGAVLVGLNLSNSNTWTAIQAIQTTTANQLSLNYDGSNKTTFSVGSSGAMTITPSGGVTTLSGALNMGSTNTNQFFAGTGFGSHTRQTVSQYQFASSTANGMRTGFYGSTSSALTVGDNYSAVIMANEPITTAATGTHAWLANTVIKSLGTVTSSGAAITNTASLYIDGASAAGTNNYTIYSAAGANYFGGSIYGGTYLGVNVPIATLTSNTWTAAFASPAGTQNVVSLIRPVNTVSNLLQFVPNGGNTTSNVNWFMGTFASSDSFSFGTYDGASSTTRFQISDTGLFSLGAVAPTHTFTLPSTSTGMASYNTTDQTTNYERVLTSWVSNVYTIAASLGGTGTARSIAITAGANSNVVFRNSADLLGHMVLNSNLTGAVNHAQLGIGGSWQNTAGQNVGLSVVPNINQTSTAGYDAIFVSPQQTGSGSGVRNLINLGTNSALNGTGTHTSVFSVSETGLVTVTKTITATGTNGAQTINKVAGSVNFAAAATSLVVTNSFVTVNSVIICTVGTNDASFSAAQAVAGAGSFTIYPNTPPGAATRVNFLVIN